MLVFKFGGASVKDADSVKNVAHVLSKYKNERLIVIISAMGKSTNLLEDIIKANTFLKRTTLLKEFKDYHLQIAQKLAIQNEFIPFINERIKHIREFIDLNEDEFHVYDEIVAQGELTSTFLIHLFLVSQQTNAIWLDARSIIKTQDEHKSTQVNWSLSQTSLANWKKQNTTQNLTITQGFIASNSKNETTTLGREGSDFSAAIIAFLFNVESVTIWKDVPGMFNADPRKFSNTIKLDQISYREAIELAYYGASVIHPKTIKPLQNKNIPLYVKSFLHPEKSGTSIKEGVDMTPIVPSYISKSQQILVSFTPKDFSFVGEKELSDIFKVLSEKKITINLMQNSALSFSVVFNQESKGLLEVIKLLEKEFLIRYNENLELLTVRHYDNKILKKLTDDKKILLEQKSRNTVRMILSLSK